MKKTLFVMCVLLAIPSFVEADAAQWHKYSYKEKKAFAEGFLEKEKEESLDKGERFLAIALSQEKYKDNLVEANVNSLDKIYKDASNSLLDAARALDIESTANLGDIKAMKKAAIRFKELESKWIKEKDSEEKMLLYSQMAVLNAIYIEERNKIYEPIAYGE